MSASFSWIAWCSPIGLPIVRRSCAYASAASNAARATPTARGRDVDAADLERAEDVAEAAARVAEHAVGGNAVTVVCISTVSMPL